VAKFRTLYRRDNFFPAPEREALAGTLLVHGAEFNR
jgi:hypothetical protein